MSGEGRKRDRRVERTRRLLTEALMELIREKGYDDITVQDVLDRADVGRSTFYAHFRNKDQLLLGDLGRGASADPAPFGDFRLFEHLAENYGLYRSLAGTDGLAPTMARLEEMVRGAARRACRERLVAGRLDAAAVDLEVLEAFLAGGMMRVIEEWLADGMPHPPDRMRSMLERVTAGVLPAAGG
jgi:AcrR family transcriptional regulator